MAEPKKVRITLRKSAIGSNKSQKDTVRALGLLKLGATRVVTLTPHMRGMVNKVSHLLDIQADVEQVAE